MATKTRPTLALDPRQMIIWNEILGAKCYRFKMINQRTQEILWYMELSSNEGKKEVGDNYYTYDYPTGKPSLEQNDTYLLIVETYNGTSLFQGQVEILLLEDTTRQAVEDFERLLDLNDQTLGELEKKWLKAKESMLNINSFFSERPWRFNCLAVFLECISS